MVRQETVMKTRMQNRKARMVTLVHAFYYAGHPLTPALSASGGEGEESGFGRFRFQMLEVVGCGA